MALIDRGDTGVERPLGQLDGSRLVELMQTLQRVARLQKQAVGAEIDAREKRREIGFKRQKVWVSDTAFMRELQRLMARENLKGFDELIRLAAECQSARDDLGPIEQEGIEAEMRWEGQIWRLRETEDHIYHEFEYEFLSASKYSSPPSTVSSRPYEPDLGDESQDEHQTYDSQERRPFWPANSVASTASFRIVEPEGSQLSSDFNSDAPDNSLLLGADDLGISLSEYGSYSLDFDSGIGDLDRSPSSLKTTDAVGPPQNLPLGPRASVELYPQLVTDFGTRRDRINKWLLHTTLASRLEANLLKDRLGVENPIVPSNWSQLVIAYWELDGAAIANTQRGTPLERSPHGHDMKRQEGGNAEGQDPTDTETRESRPDPAEAQYSAVANTDRGYYSELVPFNDGFKSNVPLRLGHQPPPLPSKASDGSDEGPQADVKDEI